MKIARGFAQFFQENFRLFSLSRPAKPALCPHLQSFRIYTLSSVSYFSVCLPLLPLSSALFAFCVPQHVDFSALASSFIHTYPCVSICNVADLPFFLTNVRTSIYIAECSSLPFPHEKAPGSPPDACLIWLLHLSIMGGVDSVRPLRTGRSPSIRLPSVPHDSAHTSRCWCC